METFRKGDIVLFPFPYTDLSNRKIRPCLVISDEMEQDIILCQITSKMTRADQYSIELKKDETLEGTLQIDSLIRTNMLFTASKFQILKRICKVTDTKYREIINKIIKTILK